MFRKFRLHFLAVIAVISLISILNPKVFAAPLDLTITPTTANIVINPGSINKGSLQVINQGSSAYDFQVYTNPYSVTGENYTPDFTVLPNKPNPSSWFQLSSSGSHANPGQTYNINYTITVPKSTQPGGYYAVIFAETKNPSSVANSVSLNERVGELFYMQVAGPVVQKGSLLTWQSSFFQKPPLIATLRLENSGGLHYMSTINYHISDILGQNKYSLYTQKIVLPDTIRRIQLPWNNTPSIGIFKVNGNVNFLGQTHNLPTTYVFVMSETIRLFTLLVLVVIIFIFLVRIVYRQIKHRRNVKKAQK